MIFNYLKIKKNKIHYALTKIRLLQAALLISPLSKYKINVSTSIN